MKWVRVNLDAELNTVRVSSNMTFEATVTMLEVAKAQLIANATQIPKEAPPEEGATLTTGRAPTFAARTVA